MQNYLFLFGALILGFILAAILGKLLIPVLKKAHLGQHVRQEGPKSHYKTQGTPTFGGIIFLITITILMIVYLIIDFNPMVLAILLFTLAHAAIGFIDDYMNTKVNNDGLSIKQKTILLVIIESIFIGFYLYGGDGQVQIILPFNWDPLIVSGGYKILYFLFLLFYFFAAINATNFSDGIDGLASSVTIVTLIFTTVTALVYKQAHVMESYPLAVISLIMIGALLGFLVYNWHVAKVFMGDTGSLGLGAFTSAIFLALDIPWAFVLAGIIYVIEIATVLIQIVYFKATGGKRFFKMTPIHHQYELEGYSEERIVFRFALTQAIGALIAGALIWQNL